MRRESHDDVYWYFMRYQTLKFPFTGEDDYRDRKIYASIEIRDIRYHMKMFLYIVQGATDVKPFQLSLA